MSSILFTPFALDNLTLANRIVIPPMCQYSATDGMAGNWHLMHYGALSLSGAGMLIVEATAITPEGRISPNDLGIWSEETAEALGRLIAAIRRYSSIPLCLQLAHAGRKASQYAPWRGNGVVPPANGGWVPEAPSALAYEHGDGNDAVPLALDLDGCERLKEAFADAAERAASIGFDAVEVHMAHGYLLHEFLSPLSNTRTDEYGGTLENRMRFPLEVFEAVRSALPAAHVAGVRVSGADWTPGGWTVEETCLLAKELQLRGCSYVHVSGGGLSPKQTILAGPSYQADMAAKVRATLQEAVEGKKAMPVIAVGLISEPEQADGIVRSGQADLVAIGRAMLYNPRWPWHAAAKLKAQVTAPPQYWRSAPYGVTGLFAQP